MVPNLQYKLSDYENRSHTKLLPNLPLIIKINGRNFQKLTSQVEKPYSEILAECFHSVLHRLCIEIQGTVFGYTYNDTFVIVVINKDENPWYDNDTQKVASAVSSLATFYFYENILSREINISLDIAFISSVFVVPNIADVINLLTLYQLENIKLSTYFACLYNLIEHEELPKEQAQLTLQRLTIEDKLEFLQNKFQIDYSSYPPSFRLGVACYRIAKTINGTTRYKLSLVKNCFLFAEEFEILEKILSETNE